MKLVSDWRQSWKWISVHALWLAGILPTVWDTFPHEWRERLPFSVICVSSAITGAVGIIGRLTDQNIDCTPPITHEDHRQ